MSVSLKLFVPEEEAFGTLPEETQNTENTKVVVTLGDLVPLIAAAQRRHYTWLQDFLDDEVLISEDLWDVLLAFHQHRPVA